VNGPFKAANPHLAKEAYRQYKLALRSGSLVRGHCVLCGDNQRPGPVEGHHEDYAYPLEVIWLCRMHHRWRHMKGISLEEQAA
jgi:hypothetical protein